MHSITRTICFLVVLALSFKIEGYCQIVSSIKDGLWTDPTVWDTNQVPTTSTATEVFVNHDVEVPIGSNLIVRNVIVSRRLVIRETAVVNLVSDDGKRDLQVFGTLVMNDGATLNGTSISNVIFESGSRYIHRQGPLGFIPYATWDANSTFEIAGFKSQGYINIAHSDSWKQNFGHVLYNCSEQTTSFVDLNGYLRSVAGNFTVATTNNQALRLSTTQNAVISIGGNFTIDGPSKIWISTNSSNATVNIQQDFRYRSTSTGISYLTTRGVVTMNIDGGIEMASPGRIHMATTTPDSTGARQATIMLRKDLTVSNGVFIAPPLPGRGRFDFIGPGLQTVNTSPTGTSFQGNVDYIVESGSSLDLKNSVLSSVTGNLLVKGKLLVGSTEPAGAIQLTNRGNIQVQGTRSFEAGSTVEYNGTSQQSIGNGHPSGPGINLICRNPAGITVLNPLVAKDVEILTKFNAQEFPLTAYGNLTIAPAVDFQSQLVTMAGGQEQQISASDATLRNLVVNKSANAITLVTPLKISERVLIQSPNTTLHSNGNLILLSISDGTGGTASVGPLPPGSSVQGDVTVNRHMAGEGRIYRYISSPIQNASVASLIDDFPITGRFSNPSTGPGLVSTNPSLFFYDESVGGLQAGWLPYPVSGLAAANPLIVGQGYAAFIRNGTSSTTWDVTGTLNQGTIELPLKFSSNSDPSNGWNLVGNPYASAIRWEDPAADKWTMENISSVIAIRDNGGAGGTFRYWDMDENYEGATGQIASCQSFWVRATGENPRLTIREGVKESGGAEFFRNEIPEIPSFAVELSQGSLRDIAYFKIRPGATNGLDPWDGLKLDNDNFDISFVGASRNSFAIHAAKFMPCDTIIQLGLKDLLPGAYSLRLITKHDFLNYDFILIDQFSKAQTTLRDGEVFSFIVSSESGSHAFDRISLRLIAREPKTDVRLVAPQWACAGDVVTVQAQGVDGKTRYSIWDVERFLSEASARDSGRLEFHIAADTLGPGNHEIRLKAHTACYTKLLPEGHVLTINSTPRVWADSAVVCQGTRATLRAHSDLPDTQFFWFMHEELSDTLATGNSFETSPLERSRTFSVVGSAASGCMSSVVAVNAVVRTISRAEISVVKESQLVSNFPTSSAWYFNGEKLDGIGSTLFLDAPGLYTLRVDTLSCVSEDTFEYILLLAESEAQQLAVYPNPMTEKLFVSPATSQSCVEIINSIGATVLKTQVGPIQPSIDVSHLALGAYMAVVTTLDRKFVFRVIKVGD